MIAAGKERPLVTIAIPTYNRADGYFPLALGSARAQTYEPLEIVVADNCSADRTGERVRACGDPRVRYFRHATPLKPNDNFNFCVEQARGRYLLLLHDDDLVDRDFVWTCLEAAHYRTDAGVIRTGARVIDANGNVLHEGPNRAAGLPARDFFLAWFDGRTALYLCNTLYNTGELRAIGGFRSRHNLFQDGIATCALAARPGRVDVAAVKASFRVHAGELTSAARVSDWCEDSLELLERMCALAGGDAEVRHRGTRFFAHVNYGRASRVRPLHQRLAAFWLVYRFFGSRHPPPWRLVASTTAVYRGLRRVKRRVRGMPEWAG